MKKWISTILYFISLFILIPFGNFINKMVYNYYFKLYGSTNDWEKYYSKINNIESKVFLVIIILIICIYILNIISSFLQVKKYKTKDIIKQAFIVQLITLIVSNIIIITEIFGTIISSINIFGALIGLPIFYLFCTVLIIMVNLIGSFRGLSSVLSSKKNKIINSNETVLYGILEFIPIINIVVTSILKEKEKNMKKVYFTKDISPEGLIKIYESLNHELKGRVAIKISTGEAGGHNYLDPNLIKDLVNKLNGTIVECNTAYAGSRMKTEDHYKTIKDHGFLDIANVDIMDEEGEIKIPLEGGKHLDGYDIVGSHIKNYDSMLMLSHFKGHAMGGFGGALKNMSIGVASSNGKAWIHSVGRTSDPDKMWGLIDDQDGFLESMAEADKAVITFFKPENMAYINVANKISIDCDCDSNPHAPEMKDIGIFASLDPVALDQCCYDQIINSTDSGKTSLVNRMLEKHAIHIVEEAEQLGIGSSEYEIINIDE